MSSKFLATLLMTTLLVPGVAALAAPPAPPVPDAQAMARQAQEDGADAAGNPELTGQVVFQVLLAEIALQRGQLELAVSAYQDLARRTRDPAVAQRATEIATAARQYGVALEMARLWVEADPESQPARQTLTGLLVVSGNLAELEAPIAQMLAADPGNLGDNFLGLNRLLARHPDKQAVLTFIEHMAQPYPTLPEAYYALAVAAAAAGQPERARSEARRAQALRPGWVDALLLETQIVLSEPGDAHVQEAVELLSGYLKQHPDVLPVRLALARVLIGARQYHQAREQFDLLLKKAPDDVEVVYPLAILALQEKDYDMARRLLLHLLDLPFPDRGAVRYFLGQTEEESGHADAALAYYEQVDGGAQYLAARGRAAQLLADAGKLDEALALLRASDVKSPHEKVQIAQMQAQLLRAAGRHQAAFAVLDEARKLQPDQPDLLYDTALAAEKIGRLQDMENLLRKLIKLQPDNAHAYNALGYSLADHNLRLKEAHELIARALKLAPRDPFILDSMGWVLYREGKLAEARAMLEDAYAIKDDPEIAAHLGEVLWKMGQHAEAIALWQKAAAQAPDNEALRATMKKFLP
jgi:tetratricopeptide (TPR) repeat protein